MNKKMLVIAVAGGISLIIMFIIVFIGKITPSTQQKPSTKISVEKQAALVAKEVVYIKKEVSKIKKTLFKINKKCQDTKKKVKKIYDITGSMDITPCKELEKYEKILVGETNKKQDKTSEFIKSKKVITY